MRKVLCALVAVALVGAAYPAFAAKAWDDMSWWGNTGAKPEPQPDGPKPWYSDKGFCKPSPEPRSGYWWWPKEPASNQGDGELWGNRGIVYHAWEKPQPKAKAPAPPAPKPEPPRYQIPVFNHVLFDFDKAVLKPEGKAEVDKVIAEMKAHPEIKATIEGHTCDIGAEQYNMGLGQRRADAVKAYMVQSGIDPNRIQTVSYGETKPAVPNTSNANRKLNRRAVFVLTLQ
jgi:outer membrane protein OmpA-like peptidoglycan-associated protein